mgnify:CR=1 FL=1
MSKGVHPVNGIYLYEDKHRESYALELHHHLYGQLLYVLEGRGSIVLEGRKEALEQDHAVLILPYADHAVSSDSHLTLLVLAFDEKLLQTSGREAVDRPLFAASALLRLNPFNASELRLLLRKLLHEQRQRDDMSDWAMSIYIQEIFLLLARARQAAQVTDANGLRAEKIRSYIDRHYYEPLTAEELAYKLGVSSRHANNIFKEQYQMTPMQYLTEVRLGIAKKLLAETDKDIVSVCFEVGYESLPTFYRAFKNGVQLSPNKYRQLHREASAPG